MKNYIYIFIFFTSLAFGQQKISPSLVSSAGASLEGWGLTSLKMDFSIGEIIIDSGFSDNFIITQGFHQENISISTLKEDFNIDVRIFPNPTTSLINIDLDLIKDFPVTVEIFDANGKECKPKDFANSKNYNISLDGLSEGIYFLLLENKNFKNIYQIHKTK